MQYFITLGAALAHLQLQYDCVFGAILWKLHVVCLLGENRTVVIYVQDSDKQC